MLKNIVYLVQCIRVGTNEEEIIIKEHGQILEKYTNIKFHGNESSGIRDVLCGRTDRLE